MRVAVLAGAMLAGSCGSVQSVPPTGLPYVAILKPPPTGEEDTLLLAAFNTRIWIDRDCVLLGNPAAGYSLPIFYRGTVVARDSRGLYLRDPESGRKFRNGDRVKGGGGASPYAGRQLDAVLTEPVPDACLARTNGRAGSVNPGLRPG